MSSRSADMPTMPMMPQRPPSQPEAETPPRRRTRWWFVLLGLVVVLGMVGYWVWMDLGRRRKAVEKMNEWGLQDLIAWMKESSEPVPGPTDPDTAKRPAPAPPTPPQAPGPGAAPSGGPGAPARLHAGVALDVGVAVIPYDPGFHGLRGGL